MTESTHGADTAADMASAAAAMAAAASQPTVWAPPQPASSPQATSFNPRRTGVSQAHAMPGGAPHGQPAPMPVGQAQPHSQAQPYAPHPHAPVSVQPYGQAMPPQAVAYAPDPAYASDPYGADPYAQPPAPHWPADPAMAPAQPHYAPTAPMHPAPSGVANPYETQGHPGMTPTEPAEAAPAKRSFLSRLSKKKTTEARSDRRAPNAARAAAPVPHATSAQLAQEPSQASTSGRKPFLLGLLTGMVVMLGVGAFLGSEPEPVASQYAPSPLADAMAPAEAPIVTSDIG